MEARAGKRLGKCGVLRPFSSPLALLELLTHNHLCTPTMDRAANNLRRSPRLAALNLLPSAVAFKSRIKNHALKATVAALRGGRIVGSNDGGRSSRAAMRSRADRSGRTYPAGRAGLVGRTSQAVSKSAGRGGNGGQTPRGGRGSPSKGCTPARPGAGLAGSRIYKKKGAAAAAAICSPSSRGSRRECSPGFETPGRYSSGSSRPGSAPYFKIRTLSDYDSDIVKEEFVPEFTESEMKEYATRKRM